MEIEFRIDNGFRPAILSRELDSSSLQLIDELQLPNFGIPAPAIEGSRAAFWRGKFNARHEAAVLALTVPAARESANEASWFIGVLQQQLLDHGDLAEVCMDVAQYSAPTLPFALKSLAQFLNVETA